MRKRGRKSKIREEDEHSTAVPPPAVHSPPPPPEHTMMRTRYSMRYLGKRVPNCAPVRSPVRKLRSTPCLSSASSPLKNNNDVAKILDQHNPQMADNPQAQEHSCETPPHQNIGGHNEKENPASPASSFNCTEIVAKVANDYIDPDEVASKAYPALVTVNGYRVKEEFVPLVRSIILKYGDICKDCISDSPKIRSWLVEKVCGVFRNLEETESLHVTPVEVKSMVEIVEFLEYMRIDVKWLRKRLDQINDVFKLSKGYSGLKDALTANLTAGERKKRELKVMKHELDEIEAERAKISEALLGTKAKIKAFYGESLVNGLL